MPEKPELGIGDVLRSMAGEGGPRSDPPEPSPVEDKVVTTGNVVDDLARLGEPTPELVDLANRAARAADESREAGAKASLLKQELLTAMKQTKTGAVELNDRTIKLTTRKSKSKTLTAMKAIKGVEGWNADKAQEVWDKLPTSLKTDLEIPMPRINPPEERT